MIQFNYHHLYYFYEVAKAGSIVKACEKLMLSQPAVSTQIKQLERSLGFPLFDRRKQRLYLTDQGRFVLEYAENIFEMGQQLVDNLKGRSGTERLTLRVGILSGSPRAFGHALVECVLDRFPAAYVNVREGPLDKLQVELREQRLDVLLTSISVHSHEQGMFVSHLIGKVPIVFAAAPAIARRNREFSPALNGVPFILPSWPNHMHDQILDLLSEWKIEPKIVVEAEDAELVRHLAISGRGIAPLNAYTVSVNQPAGSLSVFKTKRPLGLYDSVFLVARRRKWPNPVVDHLLKSFQLPTKADYL
jgi:LysR family transcriptional regulator, transcriptional activator of nhaA